MRGQSKREHCPKCNGTKMQNFVHVEAGDDIEVYVECADCEEFVARYTLSMYTSDDIYKSYLRLMHQKRMSSGSATQKEFEEFKEKILEDYCTVKGEVAKNEEQRTIDDLIEDEL